MSTIQPVNPRATVIGVLNLDMDWDAPATAGEFEYFDDNKGADAGIIFGCPCGCGEMKSLSFRSERRPIWQWDGNRKNPTLTPSINILQFDASGNQVGEHWHGWLRAGVFESC